jgi:hypothetical protein
MRNPLKGKVSFVVGALLVCWGLAAGFGVLALVGHREERAFVRDSVAVAGEVRAVRVRVETGREKDRPFERTEHYRPVVAFRTGDHSFEFEGRTETLDPDRWRVGQPVGVRYRESNPTHARIDDPEEVYTSYRGMRLGAIIFLAAGAVVVAAAKLDAHLKGRKGALTGEDARRAYYGEPE